MSTSPHRNERRNVIAAAGIRLIARDGVRALTHRAVDREAGIPEGSTSYHAKTRSALVELIVEALAARSITDTEAAAVKVNVAGQFDADRAITISELAEMLATLVDTLAARHDDMKARYALILELDESTLRDRLTTRSQVHALTRQVTASALDRAGLAASDARVEELIALTDALVFQQTVLGQSISTTSILYAYLRGCAASDTESSAASNLGSDGR